MKRALKTMGLLLAAVAVVWWAAAGANTGWTRTSVPIRTLDEVTGIEGIRYEEKFVPGIELLIGTLMGAGLLAGASLFFRNKNRIETT